MRSRLLEVIQAWPKPSGYWVAFSGGCDSSVLLHALSRLQQELIVPLRAVHVHHGLLPEADRWTAHCQVFAQRLQVPCDCLRVDAAPLRGESPEAKARQARYGALAAYLPARALLLTAQHRDDQAETVLLQLLRGSGPAGLAGMKRLAERDFGWLGRPMLDIARTDIRAYAAQHALEWVEDPANADTRLDRSYLRREVIPVLQARWPGLGVTLARSADHCAAAERLTNAAGARLLASAQGADRYRLPVAYLLQQTPDDQALLLRHWLTAAELAVPDANRLRRLVSEVAEAGVSAMPLVRWPGVEVRRYRDALYAMPPLPAVPDDLWIQWSRDRLLALPGELGTLVLGESGLALDAGAIASGQLSVRFGGEGLTVTPGGRKGRRRYKRICQDWGIPPWLRQRLPLLYVDDRPAAIGDLVACEPFGPGAGGPVVRLAWRRPPYLEQWR